MLRFKNSIIFILRLNCYYLKFLRSVLSSPWELKHASCESGELISIRSFGNCNKVTLIEEPKVNLKNGRKNKGRKSCNCPNNFKQVCGANGKTYSNECRAECDGAEIVQNCSCREGQGCKMFRP